VGATGDFHGYDASRRSGRVGNDRLEPHPSTDHDLVGLWTDDAAAVFAQINPESRASMTFIRFSNEPLPLENNGSL
jgi:hypothetical protein